MSSSNKPQTPEAIAAWAERQADDAKPVGAGAHLTPEQKQTIRIAYLETAGTVTYSELGKRCQVLIGRAVNRETVSACLKGPEFEQLRKRFDTEIKASAIERLKAAIVPAADAWARSVDVAADKGDHKPAKDLLMHTGVIEPLDDDGRAGGPLVLVAVRQGDRHYYQEAGSSRTLTPAQADALPGGATYVSNGDVPIGPSPFEGQLWSDGTRTYTREEKDELYAKHRGGIVQIGCDESDVTINLGICAPPQSQAIVPPLMTDGERTYTREEAAQLGRDGRMVIQVGGRPDRLNLGNGPGVPITPAAPTAPVLYRDPATGKTYTADEAAELKQDLGIIGLRLPGIHGSD